MSKVISDLVISYPNKSGKIVKYMRLGAQNDRYPFDLYSQQCLRLKAFLGQANAVATLQAFADGKPAKAAGMVSYGEYSGHAMFRISGSDSDKQALQFGAGKARKLIETIAKYGMPAMLATLQDIVGDAKVADSKPPRKAGKKSGAGGGKGAKPATQERDEEVADQEYLDKVHEQDNGIDAKLARNYKAISDMFKAIEMLQAECRELQAAKLVAA